MAIDPEIRFLAEKWLKELGPDAPTIIRAWCEHIGGRTMPTLLLQVAEAAERIADERSRPPHAAEPGEPA